MGLITLQQAINWLLGAVIGGAIAFAWQRRGWVFQQNLKRGTDKYEAQVSVTRETFSLVDKRIFASRLYLDALIENDKDIVAAERERYRKVVEEWNEKISGLIILIRVRFDLQSSINFEKYFLPAFTEIDRKLRQKRLTATDNNGDQALITKAVKDDLSLINLKARGMMSGMLKSTLDTINIIEDEPKISIENKTHLTHVYLLKSLFKSR